MRSLLFVATMVVAAAAQSPILEADFRDQAAPEHVFRTRVEEVRVLFTVTDKRNQPVLGVRPEQIRVIEDGEPVPATTEFRELAALPLTVALVVDNSSSVVQQSSAYRAACLLFLRQLLRPEIDRATVIRFGGKVDAGAPLTGNPEELLKAMEPGPDSGVTSLYDAVALAARKLARASAGEQRRAMLLFSDGRDNFSIATLRNAIEAAQQADVAVYAVMLTGNKEKYFAGERRVMESLAEHTGGRAFVAKQDAIPQVLAAIAEELRSQYAVAYRRNDATRGGYHRVEIAATEAAWKVRARSGYYAPEP